MAFLPDARLLVTLKGGSLLLLSADGQTVTPVSGVPAVNSVGQGGLLDIAIDPDFATTPWVYLSYAEDGSGGTGTAVARAQLVGAALQSLQVIFQQQPKVGGSGHFGSRLVFRGDKTLFVTLGERQQGSPAQDLTKTLGKVVRINRDGVPADNPFRDTPGALPGIWSYGHRNPQGATLDLEGRLLTVEHGAMGGDELNAPEAGKNYGWPIASFGLNYNGDTIGLGTSKDGMEQPLHYWDPSIAPSGLLVYSGKLIPDWRGDILFGSLNSDFLGRLDPDAPAPTGFVEERLAGPETARVRDVVEAPDGAIWFLSVGNGAAYRLAPAE